MKTANLIKNLNIIHFIKFMMLIKQLQVLNNQFKCNSISIDYNNNTYRELFIDELKLLFYKSVNFTQFILSTQQYDLNLSITQENFKSYTIKKRTSTSQLLITLKDNKIYQINIPH